MCWSISCVLDCKVTYMATVSITEDNGIHATYISYIATGKLPYTRQDKQTALQYTKYDIYIYICAVQKIRGLNWGRQDKMSWVPQINPSIYKSTPIACLLSTLECSVAGTLGTTWGTCEYRQGCTGYAPILCINIFLEKVVCLAGYDIY